MSNFATSFTSQFGTALQGIWVTWGHTADTSLVRGDKCTSPCDLTMDFQLNLFNLNLSTAKSTTTAPIFTYPLDTWQTTTCTGVAGSVVCDPSILGFYLTFLNSDTTTQQALFADAFMGFVEFTPVPNQRNSLATPDNILVALNQRSYGTAPAGQTNPSLALTNYEFDWIATAANTISSADPAPVSPATEDYKAVNPLYRTQCNEMWTVANPAQSSTATSKRCVRVNAQYTGKLVKQGSSGTSPTDIDIKYDVIKMSAGWNLYQAGTTNGLSSTASTVTTSSKYFKTSSEYSFSFP